MTSRHLALRAVVVSAEKCRSARTLSPSLRAIFRLAKRAIFLVRESR
jgi:hypothetical protein